LSHLGMWDSLANRS